MYKKTLTLAVLSLLSSTAYAGCVNTIHNIGSLSTGVRTIEIIKSTTQAEQASCKPVPYKISVWGVPYEPNFENQACSVSSSLYTHSWVMSSKKPMSGLHKVIAAMHSYEKSCPTNKFSITGYHVANSLTLSGINAKVRALLNKAF